MVITLAFMVTNYKRRCYFTEMFALAFLVVIILTHTTRVYFTKSCTETSNIDITEGARLIMKLSGSQQHAYVSVIQIALFNQ